MRIVNLRFDLWYVAPEDLPRGRIAEAGKRITRPAKSKDCGSWQLLFFSVDYILFSMNRLRNTLLQAMVIVVAAFVVGFAYNSFSVNGINPFKRIADVPIVEDPGNEVTEGIRFVDLEKTLEIIERGAVVIDSRVAEEYDHGHIPGAVLIDYYDMGNYLDEVLPILSPDQEILVYCYSPTCDDAELLARELFTLGFTRILVFKGGYEEWIESGQPVER